MKKNIKKVIVVILSMMITVTCLCNTQVFAAMPVQDASAIGQAYDGIDYNEIMKSRVYFGAMNQVTDFRSIFYGQAASAWEENTTPILWRVVGEDGDQSGLKDGAMAIYSEYVLDAMKFTTSNNQPFYEWSGEGDYDASYVQHWLNNESTYRERKGFGNSFKITEPDASISYDAELNALVRSTVDTYFIAQGPNSGNSEVVIKNTSDLPPYIPIITQGQWTSYFGSNVTPFDGWPVRQTNSIAYLPIGVYSYEGLPSHRKILYNSDGLPKTTTSPDYSIGTMNSREDIVLGKTKYGEDSLYWLRSPNGTYSDSSSTRAYTVDEGGYFYQAPTAAMGAGVRPITKLDPKSIVMMHEIISTQPTLSHQIQEDKVSDAEWNYETSTDGINNYKLTIVSDKVKLNSLNDANKDPITSSQLQVEPGETIKVTSDDYIGDYLAYKIVHTNSSGEREIVGYGTSKGSSPDELEIAGIKSAIDNSILDEGDYTLYIWAQGEDTSGKDATSVHSYEASKPLSIELKVETKKIVYTITYDGNTHTHGSAPIDAKSPYDGGSAVVILDESDLKKSDHVFLGWSTSPSGPVEYTQGSNLVITKDITLYALWAPSIKYTVTFESNGGTYVSPQTGMNLNDYVIRPTDPTKEGYRFLGWYLDDQTFLQGWDFDNDTIKGNTTLYAKWEKEESPKPELPQPETPPDLNKPDTNGAKPPAKPEVNTGANDYAAPTGDKSNIVFYLALLLVSGYIITRKKFIN